MLLIAVKLSRRLGLATWLGLSKGLGLTLLLTGLVTGVGSIPDGRKEGKGCYESETQQGVSIKGG